MIYDFFTYNGEQELLDIHLNCLTEYVDKFIIVEAKTTFTGRTKPLYFTKIEDKLKKFWNKIEYYVIDENYSSGEIALAESSPNIIGAAHWKNEFLQKESIMKAMKYYRVADEDIVYVGDVDEIWEPYDPVHPAKLKLRVYAYYLDNRSDEEFWGTLVARYGDIKNGCLNHLRSAKYIGTPDYHGWHFTSMGGYKEVKRKLDDSYTAESYNTPDVQKYLKTRVSEGTDYLGRNFHFKKDDSDWPIYLWTHQDKYRHLLKRS